MMSPSSGTGTGGAGGNGTCDVDDDNNNNSSQNKIMKNTDNNKRSIRQQVKKKTRCKYIHIHDDNASNTTSHSRSSNNHHSRRSSHGAAKSHRLRFVNELFQGILIYVMCISAPVIFGILVKWYEYYSHGSSGNITSSSIRAGSNAFSDINGMGNSNQHETLSNKSGEQQHGQHFDTDAGTIAFKLLFFTEQSFHTISKLIFNTTTTNNSTNHHHYHRIASKVLTFLSSCSKDVQFIVIATLLQSLVRVVLVHLIVPRYLVPTVAFVRNKSTHLLSSTSYAWNNDYDDKNKNDSNNNYTIHDHNDVTSPKRVLSRGQSFKQYLNDAREHSGRTLLRSLGHDTKDGLSPIRNQKNTIHRQSTFPSSLLPPLPSLQHHLNDLHKDNIFAAPRCATAIFRLICCTISCTWALLHFRNALYWPVWVGGSIKGHTKYCWDLAGTVDPSFVWKRNFFDQYPNPNIIGNNDSFDWDFDNQNSALRYFFLGQASYQLQSLCFHLLSMALLLLYGGMKSNSKNNSSDYDQEIISERSSFKSYLRPVLEHSMCLFITITTFFFSSLRRLGSICIFALEMSSLVLQLLQICINSPESYLLHKPHIIRFVHHYLAIPVFIYCRLFIIPFVVQYSVIFESKVWLRQIDHAFLPGCGRLIYHVFNGALLLTIVMNVVYLRRLIFHPYIRSIQKNQ